MQRIDCGGKFTYVFTPYAQPIAEVEDGETFEVVTEDAFVGALNSEEQNPEAIVPFFNPQTGPIFVRNTLPGDTVKISILSIEPRRNWGVSSIQGHFGALGCTKTMPLLNRPLENRVYLYDYRDGEYICRKNPLLHFPPMPFIGTIATAPAIEAISSLTPFEQGGNMDVPDVCPGNILYLSVRQPGALLYIGDCHACQGQGEACGTALEIAAIVTLRVDVLHEKPLTWPRIESPSELMCVGSARPMEDAARIACSEMIRWMGEYGWCDMDAYQAITMAADLYIGNMVDSAYSVVMKMKKDFVKREGCLL